MRAMPTLGDTVKVTKAFKASVTIKRRLAKGAQLVVSGTHKGNNRNRMWLMDEAKGVAYDISEDLDLGKVKVVSAGRGYYAGRKPTKAPKGPPPEDVTRFLKGLGTPSGRLRGVYFDSPKYWSAEPTNRQRLDHYVGGFDFRDEEDDDYDDQGWNEEAWEEEYAGPLREAVEKALEKNFGKGMFGVEIGEKGHVDVQATPKWSKAVGLKASSRRVASAYLVAGAVIELSPFRKKSPKGKTLNIGGRDYQLSTYSHMGVDLGADDLEEALCGPEGCGAHVVVPEIKNKWKYLWAYNTDDQYVMMWLVSEGNLKASGPARSFTSEILQLSKKSQINRVVDSDMRALESEMNRREDEFVKQLKEWSREMDDEHQKLVNRLVLEWFNEEYRPKVEKGFDDIERGAIPFGYKPNERVLDQLDEEYQMKSHVFHEATKTFTQDGAFDHVESQGVDTEADGVDIQAPQWAWNDVYYGMFDEMVRGQGKFSF